MNWKLNVSNSLSNTFVSKCFINIKDTGKYEGDPKTKVSIMLVAAGKLFSWSSFSFPLDICCICSFSFIHLSVTG
jgi:hypothetical protein